MISIFIPISASMLALTGSFSLATFVKLFGISFLGKSRSVKVEKDADIFMLAGMGLMAVLVIIFGILPFSVIYFLDELVKSVFEVSIYNNLIYKYGFILISTSYDYARISPIALSVVGIFVLFVTYLFIRFVGSGKTREYETFVDLIN